MATQEIGKIAVTTGGTHSTATAYPVITIVTSADGKASYISKRDVPVGIALDDTTYWQKLVENNGDDTADHEVRIEGLEENNVYDFAKKYFTYENSTSSDGHLTYTWNDNVCTINGYTPADNDSVNYLMHLVALPDGIEAGGSYPVKYNRGDTNVRLRFGFRETQQGQTSYIYFDGDGILNVPSNAAYMVVVLFVPRNNSYANKTVSVISFLSGTPVDGDLITDKIGNLIDSGADNIARDYWTLRENILAPTSHPNFSGSWNDDKTVYTVENGSTLTGDAVAYLSNMFTIPSDLKGKTFPAGLTTTDENIYVSIVVQYDGGKAFTYHEIHGDGVFTIPKDGARMRARLYFKAKDGYGTSATTHVFNGASASGFRWLNRMPGSDSSMPTYCVFGASTTEGAVHHFSVNNITYSENSVAKYVGGVLGLKSCDYSYGSTGFVSRRQGERPNYMDAIMNADADLQNAELVSLCFWYGNDADVGLSIGEFDDYYPFDEAGYDGNRTGSQAQRYAGMAEMVSKGATVFGCLNWIIRWIGTHYPKAQLVLVFNSAGANQYRAIARDSGNPMKLTFADPEDTASANLVKMDTELKKLQKALNIKIINHFSECAPFTWYQINAKNDDGTFALYSTYGDTSASPSTWTRNNHPNDDGYLQSNRVLAGQIISQFKH